MEDRLNGSEYKISIPKILGGDNAFLGPKSNGLRWIFAHSKKTNRSYELGAVVIETGDIINVPETGWRSGRDNMADAKTVLAAL